jgi:NADH-quinone oxidoreductase subunit E
MLRRLHHDQPASFAFTPENLACAQGQITKYPEGRPVLVISPLLSRARRQQDLPRSCGDGHKTAMPGFLQ